MKKRIIICALLFTNIMMQPAFAYCIYNRTSGYDTIINGNKDHGFPTQLIFSDKKIIQNNYRCDTAGPRDNDSQSTIDIFHVTKLFMSPGIEGTGRMYITGKIPACQVNVYNKGGYVVVTGNAGHFDCAVYRDAQ